MWNFQHMKTKILIDFQICISVPLKAKTFQAYTKYFLLFVKNMNFSYTAH